MSTAPLLELHDVSKRFGALTALNNLSFHVGEAEVVGLLGDNGAGKSTTVNLISGIHQPTSGHISVEGKQTLFTCRTDSANAGIETIYQNTALVDSLSITRNIFMGRERATALGFLKLAEMREIAMEVLKSAVHISGIDSPDKLVGELSVRFEQTMANAQQFVSGPARDGMAIVAGIRAAVAAFQGLRESARRRTAARTLALEEEEESLFIG